MRKIIQCYYCSNNRSKPINCMVINRTWRKFHLESIDSPIYYKTGSNDIYFHFTLDWLVRAYDLQTNDEGGQYWPYQIHYYTPKQIIDGESVGCYRGLSVVSCCHIGTFTELPILLSVEAVSKSKLYIYSVVCNAIHKDFAEKNESKIQHTYNRTSPWVF